LTCLSNPASAGHLVGGEIFYECLGNNQYIVTLKMYRDCNGQGAPFDEAVQIAMYNGSNNSLIDVVLINHPGIIDTLPFTQNIPCLVDTPDICISTASYSDTFELIIPFGGVSLVHQRCCRPPNVINIDNVSDIGSTYFAFIPDSTVAPCNSSPSYNFVPPIALCSELYLNLDYSATDRDGDSLTYTFCRPYHGGSSQNPAPTPSPPPFQNVPWEIGFDDQHQITALPVLEVDSFTGIITGRPTDLGTYAFGVCVQEWRDGIFISENKRDFQLTTLYCEVDAAAAIDSSLEACIGFDIAFFNLSTLGDSFHWNFGDSLTIHDTSSFQNPTYEYPDTGIYTITLIAFGEVCNDTTETEYRVQHKIEPFFERPKADCLDGHKYLFTPEGFFRETTVARWQFWNDTALIGDGGLPTATKQYDTIGFHSVTLHYIDTELGCKKEYTDSVYVIPNPTIEILDSLQEQCAPFEWTFSAFTTEAFKPTYKWHIDSVLLSDSISLYVEIDSVGEYDIALQLITDSMCIDTIDLLYKKHIVVNDTPSAGIEMSSLWTDMYHPDYTVFDNSSNAVSWQFYLDEEYMARSLSYDFTLPDTGNYVIAQVAEHISGCKDTAYQKIRVKPSYLFFAPNTFTPNRDGTNDIWRPSVFIYNKYNVSIIDRWGHEVFKSENPLIGWNGLKWNTADVCPNGTYTYLINVEDDEDVPYSYKGLINLLR
jgi:gliding motility-associated-like protein